MLNMRSPLDGFRSPFGRASSGSAPPSYSAEATAYFAAMSVAPSDALKDLVDDLITTLKADGTWPLIDWLGLGPMHDAQAARVNLKNPAQVASAVNSPTFTAKQGYAGDNATAYLDSGIAGTTVTATDASLFARVRSQGVSLKGVVGYGSRHRLRHGGSSLPTGIVVTLTVPSVGTTASADSQFICASRTGTTQTLQVGTTVEDTDTVATDTAANGGNIRFLAEVSSFSDAQLSYWGFGLHLSNANATLVRAACNTFVTAAEAL